MTGKGKTADLRTTPVDNMKQDSFPVIYLDGRSVSQLFAVYGKDFVAYLISFPFRRCRLIRLLALLHQVVDHCACKEITRHISSTHKIGIKFFQQKEFFPVIVLRAILSLNISHPHLPGVLSGMQIGASRSVRMVKTQTP